MADENWYGFTVVAVPGVGRAFCIPLAKFQAGISLSNYLPKETLIHNARLIPIYIKSAKCKLSADSKHCESYFGYETQKRVVLYAVDLSDIRFPLSL